MKIQGLSTAGISFFLMGLQDGSDLDSAVLGWACTLSGVGSGLIHMTVFEGSETTTGIVFTRLMRKC